MCNIKRRTLTFLGLIYRSCVFLQEAENEGVRKGDSETVNVRRRGYKRKN